MCLCSKLSGSWFGRFVKKQKNFDDSNAVSLLVYIVVYPEWFVSDSDPTFQVIADPDTDPDFT